MNFIFNFHFITEELANAMVGTGVTFLMKTMQQYPGNLTLQITVVQTIRHLAADGISSWMVLLFMCVCLCVCVRTFICV